MTIASRGGAEVNAAIMRVIFNLLSIVER